MVVPRRGSTNAVTVCHACGGHTKSEGLCRWCGDAEGSRPVTLARLADLLARAQGVAARLAARERAVVARGALAARPSTLAGDAEELARELDAWVDALRAPISAWLTAPTRHTPNNMATDPEPMPYEPRRAS